MSSPSPQKTGKNKYKLFSWRTHRYVNYHYTVGLIHLKMIPDLLCSSGFQGMCSSSNNGHY